MSIISRIKQKNTLLCGLAVLLAFPNFIRIFDNNFWGDEAFSIRLAKMSFADMIVATAEDVHPPLYYWILQIFYGIAGDNGIVYHFASVLPYLISMILALTVIRKWFSDSAAIIFMVLCSLEENAVNFNVEVRMYSWGALFLLLSFLALYRILRVNDTKAYAYFVLTSLACAYTHYYCLVSVTFFYFVLIVKALTERKAYLGKVLIACLVTVAGYLPWCFVLLQTFKRTMSDFWMTQIPYVKECIAFFFSGKMQYLLFAIMLLAIACYVWNERKNTAMVFLVAAGVSSLFGTILIGNMVSRLFRPVFIVRYLYPVCVIAWMLMAIGIAGCKHRKWLTTILVIVLLSVRIPAYLRVYQEEKVQDLLLGETLAATMEINEAEVIILTDLQSIEWTVAEYYYPNAECKFVDMTNIPILQEEKDYYLILSDELTEYEIEQFLQQGYGVETLISDGALGTIPVAAYSLRSDITESVNN